MNRNEWSAGGAWLSEDREYRYSLWRELTPLRLTAGRTALWIMLNPAAADESHDDKTVSRCIAFTRRWGYRRLEICNLFAYRATDPKELKSVGDPVGPRNRDAVIHAAGSADCIICAWGVGGRLYGQDAVVLNWLVGVDRVLHCLGYTSAGLPRHPQRFPGEPAAPVPFRPGAPKTAI